MQEKLIIQHINNPITHEKDLVEIDYLGQSLGDIVASVIPEGVDFRVYKNGSLVIADCFEFTEPVSQFDNVMIVPLIEGGDMGRIVGMIAITVLSVYTAGAFSAGYWLMGGNIAIGGVAAMATGMAAGLAVSIAGGMLLNTLFPIPSPTTAGISNEPGSHYSWNPAVTQQQGVTIQKIYGTLRVKHGNVINAFRSVETGYNPNSLNAMISYGYGPIKAITDVKINDQYEDEETTLQLHRRFGELRQPVIPGFENTYNADTTTSSLTDSSGEFTRAIPAGYDRVEVTISFPSGLFRINDKGKTRNQDAEFTARLVNDTTGDISYFAGDGTPTSIDPLVMWTYGEYSYYTESDCGDHGCAVTQEWIQYDSKTVSDIESVDLVKDPAHPGAYWRKVELSSNAKYYGATPSFTVRQKTKDYFDFNLAAEIHQDYAYTLYIERTNGDPENGVAVSNLISVKHVAYESLSYPKNVLLSVNGAPTERFSGGIELSPLIEGALVNVYNGTSWNVEYSDNPAWVAYDIATQPLIDETHTIVRYDGFQPSTINLNDFYTWAQLCDELVPDATGTGTEKRFVFNGIFDSAISLWDSLTKLSALFRASIYWNGSELRCYTEKVVSGPSQIFSAGNILRGSFRESFASWEDRATEIEMRFSDEDADYEVAQIAVHDLGLTQARNKVSIEAFGTTRRSQAWRIATYYLKKNEYLFRTITFDSYVEYLDCTLGDVIEFQHDLPDWGSGGRLDSADLGNKYIYLSIIPSAAPFLEIGFSQATYDSWLVGGAGSEIDLSADSGMTIHVRAKTGEYYTTAIWGLGWDEATKLAKVILDPAMSFPVTPSRDDVYTISTTANGASKLFMLTNISSSSENVATLTAVEYDARVFSESDVAAEVDDTTFNPPVIFPIVHGLSASSHMYFNDSNQYVRDLLVSWLLPTDRASFDHANIIIYGGDSATTCTELCAMGSTPASPFLSPQIDLYDWYKIIVYSTNKFGQTQSINSAPSIIYNAVDIDESEVPYMLTGVVNLRVTNSSGDERTFVDKDCNIAWDSPTGLWENTSWLRHYQIDILVSGSSTVLRTAVTTEIEWILTLAMNEAMGLTREFDVSVICVSASGELGVAVVIPVSNLQAPQVVGVAGETSFSAVDISWNGSVVPDLAGYEVHVSTDNINFTPNSSTLKSTVGAGTVNATIVMTSDGTYFSKVGAFDVFDQDNLAYSVGIEYDIDSTISATNLVDFPEEISNQYLVPVIPDGVFSLAGGTFSWTAHDIWYDGVQISIDAGSTTDPYIWWDGPSATAYSTTTDVTTFHDLDPENPAHDWQIAINRGTSYELGYQSAANMVVGTLNVGLAAIQNANIGNIIESTDFELVEETEPPTGIGHAEGWRIDKDGKIIGTDIEIWNADGTLLLGTESGGGTIDTNADNTHDAISARTIVDSGGLKVIDNVYNRYAEITPGSVSLFRNNVLYTALSRTETGPCTTGVPIFFTPAFISKPTVICVIKRMAVYADETFDNFIEVEAANVTVDGFEPRGLYTNEGVDTLPFPIDVYIRDNDYSTTSGYYETLIIDTDAGTDVDDPPNNGYRFIDYNGTSGSPNVQRIKLNLFLGASGSYTRHYSEGESEEVSWVSEAKGYIYYEANYGMDDWVEFKTPEMYGSYTWISPEFTVAGGFTVGMRRVKIHEREGTITVQSADVTGEGGNEAVTIDMNYIAIEGGGTVYTIGMLSGPGAVYPLTTSPLTATSVELDGGIFWMVFADSGATTYGLRHDGSVICDTSAVCANETELVYIHAMNAEGERVICTRADGTVAVYGDASIDVSSWATITKACVGNESALGLKADGTVVEAGTAYNLGTATASWVGVVDIAVTNNSAFGLKSDGTVYQAYWTSTTIDVSAWVSVVSLCADVDGVYGLVDDGTVLSGTANDTSLWTDVVEISSCEGDVYGLIDTGLVVSTGAGAVDPAAVGGVVSIQASKNGLIGTYSDRTVFTLGGETYIEDVAGWDFYTFKP